ncbi:type VII secretion integral membrane protein EccD [Amycolatopsis japonica]
MSSTTIARSAEVCRLTVVGPQSRADLAVPLAATITALLPVLVGQLVPEQDRGTEWALQRLGERPLDLDATVETAQLRDGEEIYLRPVGETLAELDFDDLADGIAGTINRRPDLWQPSLTRTLFTALGALGFAVLLTGIIVSSPGRLTGVYAATVAVLALSGAVVVARRYAEKRIAAVLGLGGCASAATAGLAAPYGDSIVGAATALDLVLAGAFAIIGATLMVAVARLSRPVFGAVALLGLTAMCGGILVLSADLTAQQSASTIAFLSFFGLVAGPRIAMRLVHLAGPQLPRKSEELQEDIEPEPAALVGVRVQGAVGYLIALSVSVGLILALTGWVILRDPGWDTWCFVAALTVAFLLRAPGNRVKWQRIPISVGGALLAGELVMSWFEESGPVVRSTLVGLLCLMVAILLYAAVRLPVRRPLPRWRRLADVAEVVSAVALVPLLAQLLGLFAYFRGLAG